MKRTVSIIAVLILVSVFFTRSLPAAEKKIYFFGALGTATEPFDEVLMDVGVEFQLAGGLYVQFLANSRIDSSGDYYYPYYYHPTYIYPSIVDIAISFSSLYGLDAYWVYKAPVSKRVNLFGKAGVTYMFYSKYYYLEEDDTPVKVSRNGLGAGAGLELKLGERLNLVFGGNYEILFGRKSSVPNLGGEKKNTSWTKFYIGFNYRIY
jgi:hypothetical protein